MLFERKHDGFRALSYVTERRCELISRPSTFTDEGSRTVRVIGDSRVYRGTRLLIYDDVVSVPTKVTDELLQRH